MKLSTNPRLFWVLTVNFLFIFLLFVWMDYEMADQMMEEKTLIINAIKALLQTIFLLIILLLFSKKGENDLS